MATKKPAEAQVWRLRKEGVDFEERIEYFRTGELPAPMGVVVVPKDHEDATLWVQILQKRGYHWDDPDDAAPEDFHV